MGGPGVGEALELTPSIWVRTGSLSGITSEAARKAGRGLSSSQSARAPWRPEPGTGCRKAEGFPGPPRPVQRQRRRQLLSHPTKYKPGRPGADPAKPPQSALPPGATGPRIVLGSLRGWRGGGRCPGFGSAVACLAGDGPHFLPFQRPGRLAGGWRRERVLVFWSSRTPLFARKRPARSN